MPATNGDDILEGDNDANVISGLGGNDKISGRGGGDTLFGDSLSFPFPGPFGNDRLYGENGDDRLFGGGGNDKLYGGKNDDELFGGNDDDKLYGGGNDDELNGGAGADTFAFETIGGAVNLDDVITDFVEGVDRIDVSKIDANAGQSGNQAFSVVDGDFTAAGQVRSFQLGGLTYVYLNTDADAQAESAFTLSGVHDLSASDFVL